MTPLLQSTLLKFKATATRSTKLDGEFRWSCSGPFRDGKKTNRRKLHLTQATVHTAIKRRPNKPRRWILKPLLRSTRQNEKAAADRSTTLDGEISTLLSELGALTQRQLQLDTMRADEGTISPRPKSTLTRASRKCIIALDTLRNFLRSFIGPAACFIRGLVQIRRRRIFRHGCSKSSRVISPTYGRNCRCRGPRLATRKITQDNKSNKAQRCACLVRAG